MFVALLPHRLPSYLKSSDESPRESNTGPEASGRRANTLATFQQQITCTHGETILVLYNFISFTVSIQNTKRSKCITTTWSKTLGEVWLGGGSTTPPAGKGGSWVRSWARHSQRGLFASNSPLPPPPKNSFIWVLKSLLYYLSVDTGIHNTGLFHQANRFDK
jgi:hypothetical protein